MSRPIYRRSIGQYIGSVFQKVHYLSLVRMRTYRHPWTDFVRRYLVDRGTYPAVVEVKDSAGQTCAINVRSRFDVLTIHEIFVWRCYPASGDERAIIDLGSNIGVSMAYFLANAPQATVYGVEPLEENLVLARANTEKYADRAQLVEAAVLDHAGTTSFSVEPTGRYSGVGLDLDETRTVPCIHINELVERVVSEHGQVDLIKVDIEGAEGTVLRAIDPAAFEKIGTIAIEGDEVPHDFLLERGYTHHLHESGVHWYDRVPR